MNKTISRNFIIVFAFFFTLLVAITVIIYSYSRRTIQSELIHINENMNQNVAQSMDDLVENLQYVTASLAINEMVSMYFQTDQTDLLIDSHLERVTEQLNAYIHGFNYIDSIYIYSEKYNTCITPSREYTMGLPADMPDSNWLPLLSQMESNNSIFVRKIGDLYPYVLSLIHRSDTGSGVGYIILNLDLNYLPIALKSGAVSNIYIVGQDDTILYRKRQADISESLSTCDELKHYRSDDKDFSLFIDGSDPAIYTQEASAFYPWTYVTVTRLSDYTLQLTRLRNTLALVFAGLFLLLCLLAMVVSFSSYRPIRKLLEFLNNPVNWNTSANLEEGEIQYIVEKITAYAQANTHLAEELQNRLAILKSTQVIALQSQINPHFMVNTLNLIYCELEEVLGTKHLASVMTFNLGRLLGYSLDSTFLVTLNEELQNTLCYLNILSARYPDSLIVNILPNETACNIKVPKLILQPLIENCIYHGLKNQQDTTLVITVESSLCAINGTNYVQITVSDTGLGIPPEKLAELRKQIHGEISLSSAHIGLKNVASRLRLLYGDAYYMDLESREGEGTVISIYIDTEHAVSTQNDSVNTACNE